MSSSFYGLDAAWPELASGNSGDSFLLDSNEKSAFASSDYSNDLEEVVRILADDDFETKAAWNEADHPRDEGGRFTDRVRPYSLSRNVKNKEEEDARAELNKVHAVLGTIYPGLTSRWGGDINVQHYLTLKALGLKEWSCRISVAYELLEHPAYKIGTMAHEALHALSPTTKEQYEHIPGWEEAVVEGATRLHQAKIAQQLGASITKDEFDQRNRDNAYGELVVSLERLRKGLRLESEPFYDSLMRLPATERIEFIRAKARELSPEDLESFRVTFKIHAKILDDYVSPKRSPFSTTKGYSSAMSQDEVISIILSARTREEVIHAQEVMMDWMKDHPTDLKVLSGGEMLAMLAEAKGIKNPNLNAHVTAPS